MGDPFEVKTVYVRGHLEELLGADLMKPVEVTPHDKWDFFVVANDPEINAPREFRRGDFVDFKIETGEAEMSSRVSFIVPKSEWRPFTEAFQELQALTASADARRRLPGRGGRVQLPVHRLREQDGRRRAVDEAGDGAAGVRHAERPARLREEGRAVSHHPDLSPCPFCNSTDLDVTWDDKRRSIVMCVDCEAQGPPSQDNRMTEAERNEAKGRWNERPHP